MSKLSLAAIAFACTGTLAALIGVPQTVSRPADASPAPVASGADAAHPAVIELYQSQGCSSCPPALAVLDTLANRPDVLALNFAVTYWDQLGWKDTYARPAYTARQWDYSHAQGRSNVQTPQLIVNGRVATLGSNKADVERTIAANARPPGPDIATEGSEVRIADGRTAKPATLWLVAYDPRTVQVPIRAGENNGRTLPHRNMVRQLVPLGTWTGHAAKFRLPPLTAGLARAILVQTGKGGPIIAAARI